MAVNSILNSNVRTMIPADMNPYDLLSWIEGSALSVWLRESPSLWAFPFVLILHTIGMGFLVGTNIAIDLRVLGFARSIPSSLLERFFVIMKVAFVVNATSGILLLAAYPTKAMTNPLFYIKLLLIAFALVQTAWIHRRVLRADESESHSSSRGKLLAGSSIAVWAAAVTSGRLLAYTYKYLLAGDLK
jgi:hypothetical protein